MLHTKNISNENSWESNKIYLYNLFQMILTLYWHTLSKCSNNYFLSVSCQQKTKCLKIPILASEPSYLLHLDFFETFWARFPFLLLI